MHLDVVDLKRFYARPLGEAARSMILRRIQALWPSARGLDMAGIGYAAPYLEPYRDSARRIVAAMPGRQGAEHWPEDGRGCACLVEETALPFRDSAFDRVIVAHGLEESDSLRLSLREVWRICSGEARAIIIVPSRVSLWSMSAASPFGHGRPFTRLQLSRLLREAGFEPTAWARALYAPPLDWSVVARSATGWEMAGETLWHGLGGVILAEARKRAAVPPRGLGAPAFGIAPARA